MEKRLLDTDAFNSLLDLKVGMQDLILCLIQADHSNTVMPFCPAVLMVSVLPLINVSNFVNTFYLHFSYSANYS